MKKYTFAQWIVVMLIIVIGGGASYYLTNASDVAALVQSATGSETEVAPITVTGGQTTRKDLADTVSATGSVTASKSADLSSEQSGVISKIDFTEGQFVQEGDVLLEIGTTDQITAPFEGVVGLCNCKIGDTVKAGQVLTTIDTIDPMEIEFAIPEKDYATVHEGQQVNFTVDAFPDLFFKGEIYAINSRIDPKTQSFEAKAMAANPDNKLRTGMKADLAIATSVHHNVLTVPTDAIITKGTEKFVFVINDNIATMTAVKTGIEQGDFIEILSGLTDRQDIVIDGADALENGSKVNVEHATDQEDDTAPVDDTTEDQD